jgi:hypothetical protein
VVHGVILPSPGGRATFQSRRSVRAFVVPFVVGKMNWLRYLDSRCNLCYYVTNWLVINFREVHPELAFTSRGMKIGS